MWFWFISHWQYTEAEAKFNRCIPVGSRKSNDKNFLSWFGCFTRTTSIACSESNSIIECEIPLFPLTNHFSDYIIVLVHISLISWSDSRNHCYWWFVLLCTDFNACINSNWYSFHENGNFTLKWFFSEFLGSKHFGRLQNKSHRIVFFSFFHFKMTCVYENASNEIQMKRPNIQLISDAAKWIDLMDDVYILQAT